MNTRSFYVTMPKRGYGSAFGYFDRVAAAAQRLDNLRRRVARGPIGTVNRAIERGATSAFRSASRYLRGPSRTQRRSTRRRRRGPPGGGAGGHRRSHYRVNTTGFAGHFNKRKLRVKKDMGMVHGAVYKYEKGGTEEAPKAIYIGHSCAQYTYEHRAFWEAIMRQLVRMTGTEIQSVADTVTGQVLLQYYDKADTTSVRKSLTFPVAAGTVTTLSIQDWAIQIGIRLYNEVSASNEADFVMDRIVWTVDPTTNAGLQSIIHCKSAKVIMKTESHLRLQNQTLASAGVDSANATEVENNPLTGRMYMTKNGGYIPLERPQSASPTWEGFIPDGVGLISGSAAGDNPTFLSKPPHPSYFKSSTLSNKVYLAPGQIKSSHIYDTVSTTITKFLQKNRRLILALGGDAVFQEATRQYRWDGPSKMYGFEKLLDARVVGAPPISIGWQLEARVSCALFVTKKLEIPETVVDTV